MKHLSSLIAGASLLALSAVANADEPMTLSDDQMDNVTAGASAAAAAVGLTLGDIFSETASFTTVYADGPGLLAIAEASNVSIAASLVFGASAHSSSISIATLP